MNPISCRAIILDLDGVITQTARAHAEAWKAMFDAFLSERGERAGEDHRPFDIDGDYRRYVDGKPRYDGVRSFLESRGIELPEGTPGDAPDEATICGLGNRKNEMFQRRLNERGVEVFDDTIEMMNRWRDEGLKLAVVSSSRNCKPVLRAAGLDGAFEARVDGVIAKELGLPGKPKPDTFLEAARRLGVDPKEAVVLEDAESGVEAGRAGEFGLVVGVDRGGAEAALREHGADLVVQDVRKLNFSRTRKQE